MSRIETILNALINGGDISGFEPQSRCEAILKSCCTGEAHNITPQSRIEALLEVLRQNLADGGGGKALAKYDGTVVIE